jgi:UDP-4-amino-4,6-dideoxy-N-acetyl-beta-L-altrosamine transaminase
MPNKNNIPYGRQNITQQDIDAVVEVLKSDFLTQGPKVREFEERFAEYVHAKYAVAVTNGTAALHLCNLAIGTKPGDKVITTPITFAASANAVLYCRGEVDFVDIEPKTYTLDLNKLEKKLAASPKGTYKGVIPVDLGGYPVDVERLRKIVDEYGLWIIEDACHAPGGYFKDSKGIKQYCGNGVYSDLQIFSFHPVKHIATGEGGMITTNDEKLYKKLLLLRTHGITKDTNLFINSIETALGAQPLNANSQQPTAKNYPGWYYEMQELGYNYRISDINCALGISQLKRVKQGVELRNKIARKYNEAFKNIEAVKTPFVAGNVYHAYHLYIIQVEKRKELYDYLRQHNIFTQVHYIPVHLQPYYKQLGWKKGDFPVAEAYYEEALSLPMFPALTEEQQDFVIEKIVEFFE